MVEVVDPFPVLLVPGWRNSGPNHWQSRWQEARPHFTRVDFKEWDQPKPQSWTALLRRAVLASPRPPLLIAHSLGCLATANLLASPAPPPIAGVFLVAPPNPGQPGSPVELAHFAPPSRSPFEVPGLIVISSNDAYAEEAYSLALANDWGLNAVRLGACGHINDESGHGDWPEGLVLLDGLIHQLNHLLA